MRGSRSGNEGGPSVREAVSLFRDDEGGFTTVAAAVSLLLSLTLVFASASAAWVSARSAEVQRVADAAAMAGANVVARFSTIAQVTDACVLSMGLTGVVVYGGGLVASCVPGLTSTGLELCAAGGRILEARRTFASSAADGLARLEKALPALVVANSSSCVAANSEDGLSYAGCALPFPTTSSSDFSAFEADVDDARMGELSERMRDASAEAEEAKDAADDALLRGWMADCGSRPYSLYERASSLAGLDGFANPYYASPESWTFGVALMRAREYYAARLASARVDGHTPEELTDAACRRAFYAYALERVRAGSWAELADGTVVSDLPSLPRNADETRACELYTLRDWPCTTEGGSRTLHCSLACPGARGGASGTASLQELEAGTVAACDECRMDVGDLGRVAAASTSIENGFEHHWRIIVEASEDYEAARAELAEAERRTRELAEEGEDAFSDALEELSVERPTLCPPGAWGCVAVVARGEGVVIPTELTASFLESAELPAGSAVAAATLAPDEATAENNVLSRFLDSVSAGDSAIGGALDGVTDLWGELLVGYGSAYGSVADAGSKFLDGVDGVLGGSVGSWLKGRLEGVMEGLGFDPVDMRLRKPVLTNTQDVLDRAGFERTSTVRSLVARLPDAATPYDFARAVGVLLTGGEGGTLTIAELEIPGTDVSIPLEVDLSFLGAAS